MNYYRKIFFVTFLLLICCSFIMADVVWEGTAAMSRFGEFPLKGFYGASNSFPVNTVISVENAKNKKSIEVIIVDTLHDKNLFLLLSKDAAEILDIKQDEIFPIKAQIVKEAPSGIINGDSKTLGANPDSPILANVAEIENFLSKDTATDSPVASSADKVPQKVVIIYGDAGTIKLVEDKTDEAINEERSMEDSLVSSDFEPAPVKEKSDSTAIAKAKSVDEEIFAPTDRYYENGEKRYFLRPTDLKPPVVDDSKETIASVPITKDTAVSGLVADNTVVIPTPEKRDNSKIAKESYYVQLIAFKDYSSAEKVKKSVNIDYPVIIYYDEKQFLYKVMAGPLKTDERGVVLHKARNIGYKDAFIRKGE